MTSSDRQNIKEMHYIHRYTKAAIARLFGLSRMRITAIVNESKEDFFETDEDCLFCGNDEATTLYIDGNDQNNNPQNKVKLCKMHTERILHLKIRRS